MAGLCAPDRPDTGLIEWYVERAARCIEQIWKVTTRVVDAGTNVVLEIGLLQRREREALYRRVEAGACHLTVYVVDAPHEVRRERVEQRNVQKGETFSMVVPPHIFEMASDRWEPPDEHERAAVVVRMLSTAD